MFFSAPVEAAAPASFFAVVLLVFGGLASIFASVFRVESTRDLTSIFGRSMGILLSFLASLASSALGFLKSLTSLIESSILLTDCSRRVFFIMLSAVLVVEDSLVRASDLLRDAVACFRAGFFSMVAAEGGGILCGLVWQTCDFRNSRWRHFSKPSRILCCGALPGNRRRVTISVGSAGCQTSRAHTDTRSKRGIWNSFPPILTVLVAPNTPFASPFFHSRSNSFTSTLSRLGLMMYISKLPCPTFAFIHRKNKEYRRGSSVHSSRTPKYARPEQSFLRKRVREREREREREKR